MKHPIIIDTLPDLQMKQIKKPVYEDYVVVSEEMKIKRPTFLTDMIQHKIAEFRTRNFFVKKIYAKYLIPAQGLTVFAFELVRLREPVVEPLEK